MSQMNTDQFVDRRDASALAQTYEVSIFCWKKYQIIYLTVLSLLFSGCNVPFNVVSGNLGNIGSLPEPSSFSGAAFSTTQVNLSWSAAGNATFGYRISYQTGSTAPNDCATGTVISENSVIGTSHSVTGLSPNTEYSFRVCAVDSSGAALVSNGVTFTTTTYSSLTWSSGKDIAITRHSGYTFTYTATGGVPPYTYSIDSPLGGGSIDPNTGVYTAGNLSGVDTILVEDAIGQQITGSAENLPLLTNGAVMSQAFDGAGGWYLGGYFTRVLSQSAPRIAKINLADSTIDLSFSLRGFDGDVHAILKLPNGGFIVGGNFNSYRGISRQKIAKLQADGSLDLTFDSASGFDNAVYSLDVSTSDVFVGGDFTTYKGSPRLRMAKLDLNTGSLDNTFDSSMGFDSRVKTILYDTGHVYAGGSFTSYNGSAPLYLAKLDSITGALNATFDTTTAFNGDVNTLAIDSGSIYVGGGFSTFGATARQSIAKLDATTAALDMTFDSSTGFNNSVTSITLDSGSIYAGGRFTSYGGTTRQRIAKLSATSAVLDSTFDSTSGFDDEVKSLHIDSSKLYAGGNFGYYGGTQWVRLARLDSSTAALDSTFSSNNGLTQNVNTIAVDATSIYAGGSFHAFGGILRQRIAKFDQTTQNLDTTFNSASGFNSTVFTLLYDSGAIYAGGEFNVYKGSTRLGVAKINSTTGAVDSTFNAASGFDDDVLTLSLSGGSLYVGGSFTSYGGTGRLRLAKLSATTAALDGTFNTATGFNNTVQSIVVNSGMVYVGGDFTDYKGTTRARLAKVDGSTATLDGTFDIATGANSSVQNLIFDSGNIYAVGTFDTYKATTVGKVMKISATSGALDGTFSSGTGFNAMPKSVIINGSDLYIGGGFTSYNGTSRFGVVKMNATTGTLDNTFDPGTGYASKLVTNLRLDSGILYVGSYAETYQDLFRFFINRISPTDASDLDAP